MTYLGELPAEKAEREERESRAMQRKARRPKHVMPINAQFANPERGPVAVFVEDDAKALIALITNAKSIQ